MTINRKEEIKKKIAELLKAEAAKIEAAAKEMAPGFDYEAAEAELEAEEANEAVTKTEPDETEETNEVTTETEVAETAEPEVEEPLPPAELSPSKYPKPRRVYRTWFGRTFLNDANGRVLGVTILMLAAVISWYGSYWLPLYRADAATESIVQGKTAHEESIFERTRTKEETIRAESLVILDPKLDSGVQEKTEGHDGKAIFSYTTRSVSGRKLGTERRLEKWIEKPEDHVLHLGTKRTGHEGTYRIVGTFTANCSAYWMGNSCYGAGGGHCEYGTTAVDPSRYGYGTLFWVEGYGDAVANDCGTSIKGNKLDLWMDSYAESCRWGRRYMTTYVLEEVKK